MLKLMQLGLNTSDLAGSLRLYSEALGFQNSGGQCIWGSTILIQGLGARDRAVMWWMVGAQPLFQLEFFHHSRPAQRPLRPDWRPTDHGWVRFGVAVADFDACMQALAVNEVSLLAPVAGNAGSRRAAVRDPYVGIIIEIIEGGSDAGPRIVYAASSVSDLVAARQYYADVLQFPVEPLESLHSAADEALWGLDQPERDGFVVRVGEMRLEIVRYLAPAGRPKPADYRMSDQGMCNIALGSDDINDVETALTRLERAGIYSPHILRDEGVLAFYINDPEREVEFTGLSAAALAMFGFNAVGPFLE